MSLPSDSESELRTGTQGPIQATQMPTTSGKVDGFSRSDTLYNDRPAARTYTREMPQHRVMVILKAQGYTNREIAAAMEVSSDNVCQVLRQPWARARLLDIFEERGMSKIDALLSGEAIASLETLIEIRDTEESGPQARLAASNSLLDRYLGKPKERVEMKTDTTLRDAAEVDAELARLEATEAALLGRSVKGN